MGITGEQERMRIGYYISYTHNYTITYTTDNYDTIAQHHVFLVASRYLSLRLHETNMDTLTCLPISMLTSLSSSRSLLLPNSSTCTGA